MLIQGLQHYVGFAERDAEFFAFMVVLISIILGAIAAVACMMWIADCVGELQLRAKRRADATPATGRISGAAPNLPVPHSGHEECGGKFCELRGCAILGSCQRPV